MTVAIMKEVLELNLLSQTNSSSGTSSTSPLYLGFDSMACPFTFLSRKGENEKIISKRSLMERFFFFFFFEKSLVEGNTKFQTMYSNHEKRKTSDRHLSFQDKNVDKPKSRTPHVVCIC